MKKNFLIIIIITTIITSINIYNNNQNKKEYIYNNIISNENKIDDKYNIVSIQEDKNDELNNETQNSKIKLMTNIKIDNETSNATSVKDNIFSLSKCNLGTLTKKNKKKKELWKLKRCVKNYRFYKRNQANNISKLAQNFAVTDNYIYFSGTYDSTWKAKNECNNNLTLKAVSTQYITRLRKNGSGAIQEYMTIDYAGHAQSFDVLTNNNKDIIYANALPFIENFYGREEESSCGARYRGVLYTKFETVESKIPQKVIAIKKNYDLNIIDYQNSTSTGKNKNYVRDPEVAVDHKSNSLAIITEDKTVKIYNLSKFNKGIKQLKSKKFKIVSGSVQGIELYKGFLYVWYGKTDMDFKLIKYNINSSKPGKCYKVLATISANALKNYYKQERQKIEAEGMSIHNGNIYLGIASRDKNDDRIFYNDVFKIEIK